LLAQLCGGNERVAPVRGASVLLIAAFIAALASVLFAIRWDLHYAASAEAARSWDFLWRTSVWKQISGYSVLALSAMALILSLRKRIKPFIAGEFGIWRIAHAVIGVLTLAGLLVHTGGRLGANLNLLLMSTFLLLVLLGSATSAVLALEHRFKQPLLALKRGTVWAHILLFWPIPALLGMHICKSYFF
jgi:nitrite reductase (NADH) large subunit